MIEAPAQTPGDPAPAGRGERRLWWVWVASAVAAIVVLLVAGRLARGGDGDDRLEGAHVPLTTSSGGTATLADFAGEPLVVNFFASWCPPCRAEMPELERVHTQVGDGVRFLGVNVDYDESTWKSLVAESGITFETVFEPRQDLLREVGGKGMPTTLLVTADGRIRHVHTGALDAPALRRLIQDHLGV
jgi:thiol-disulfide isomerase/thioredoxin